MGLSRVSQLSLFDSVTGPVLKPGTICAQSWAWCGYIQDVFPYWIVMSFSHPGYYGEGSGKVLSHKDFTFDDPAKFPLQYYCKAIPFGIAPEEVHWFSPKDLIDTGKQWRVPSQDELRLWVKNNSRGYLDMKRRPFQEESELIAILETLPLSWEFGAYQRATYHQDLINAGYKPTRKWS